MQKVYMVAPWEQYYGYDMAGARFFTSKEEAERFCAKRHEKDSSWEVEEYDVDQELN